MVTLTVNNYEGQHPTLHRSTVDSKKKIHQQQKIIIILELLGNNIKIDGFSLSNMKKTLAHILSEEVCMWVDGRPQNLRSYRTIEIYRQHTTRSKILGNNTITE